MKYYNRNEFLNELNFLQSEVDLYRIGLRKDSFIIKEIDNLDKIISGYFNEICDFSNSYIEASASWLNQILDEIKTNMDKIERLLETRNKNCKRRRKKSPFEF